MSSKLFMRLLRYYLAVSWLCADLYTQAIQRAICRRLVGIFNFGQINSVSITGRSTRLNPFEQRNFI